MKAFADETSKPRIVGHSWEEHEEKYQSSLNEICDQTINEARENEISKLRNLTLNATEATLEELINEPIYDLKDNFWQ